MSEEEVVSEDDEVVAEDEEVVSEDDEVVAEDEEVVSEDEEVVTEDEALVSEDEALVSVRPWVLEEDELEVPVPEVPSVAVPLLGPDDPPVLEAELPTLAMTPPEATSPSVSLPTEMGGARHAAGQTRVVTRTE